MRVAVVTEQLLAPVPGGIGRYTAELTAALVRTAGPDDTVDGWTAWHRNLAAARVDGAGGPHRLAAPRRPLTALWERGIGPAPRSADVVHATSLLVPPERGVPQVVTIHDTVPWTHPETLTPRGVHWHKLMAARVARSHAQVVVPSAVVAADLPSVLPDLDPARIHALGAGVSRALQTPPTPDRMDAVSAALKLPDRYLLTLATLEPRKGLDVLVAALARLGTAAPPLLVVGQPGWGGVDADDAAKRAGLPNGTVRALGRISDDDLGVVLRRARALVAPSRAEGFGLPVAEAMAAGTPVICSDVPALVEVSGGAATVVRRGDDAALATAIETLDSDAALRQRMSAAGTARAAAYDWDTVGRRAWELYRSLGR